MYGFLAAGLAGALALFLWNSNGKLHEEIGELESANKSLRNEILMVAEANATVRETLDVCKEINAHNAAERDAAMLAAELASGRVQILTNELETLNDITFETDDQECRSLDAPLPSNFANWLCISKADNCDPD